MSALANAIRITKAVNNVSKLLTNLSLSSAIVNPSIQAPRLRIAPYRCAFLHATSRRYDLMEFFDDEKNWGEVEIRVGRSWKKDELRIKSNEDLHKLWFVLLKERNMLMTMEHVAEEEYEVFPNPERRDKIDESMANLEQIVRERNQAYHLLETGENGERPGTCTFNQLGLKYYYRMSEHKIPKFMNKAWREKYKFGYRGHAVRKFLGLYREKLWDAKRRARVRNNNHVMGLLKRFPNLDMEAVKEQYPDVNITYVKNHKKSRGHYVPE